MRLLLDTHVLLWWVTDDRKLPRPCAAWIEDRANDIAISPVSAYEIRFKALKGLLPHGEAAIEAIGRVAEQAGFVSLPLTWAHALAAGALPLPHRDPFDRLLAGQAIVDGYTLLAADAAFDTLGAPRVWS
ncbi:MAG: type II toxin-antitoxin system VapC family toxin [Acetobacteraceae bacterium]|nr:type II toxin-antitoxin system VapC family toxin [Acetobacteraceae bacterium]